MLLWWYDSSWIYQCNAIKVKSTLITTFIPNVLNVRSRINNTIWYVYSHLLRDYFDYSAEMVLCPLHKGFQCTLIMLAILFLIKILYSPQNNSRYFCIFHKKYRFFDSSVTEEFCINVVILRLVSIFILVEICNIFPEQPILCEHKILCKYNGISHLCEDALQPPLYCCQNQHLLDDLTNQHLLDDLTALSQLLT